jgi:probable rRNA maturation factor
MVVVQIAKNFQDVEVCLPKLERLVKAICKRFKLSGATVSIAIVDNAEMRKVNARFLNRKRSSDCLSFDLSDDAAPETARSFELVVNGEKAVEEACSRGHSSEAEVALYVTHGLLHNLGFDDSVPKKAKKMHDTEDEILQQFGYGFVYNRAIVTQRHKGTGA